LCEWTLVGIAVANISALGHIGDGKFTCPANATGAAHSGFTHGSFIAATKPRVVLAGLKHFPGAIIRVVCGDLSEALFSATWAACRPVEDGEYISRAQSNLRVFSHTHAGLAHPFWFAGRATVSTNNRCFSRCTSKNVYAAISTNGWFHSGFAGRTIIRNYWRLSIIASGRLAKGAEWAAHGDTLPQNHMGQEQAD
jgi:hypothetical protein